MPSEERIHGHELCEVDVPCDCGDDECPECPWCKPEYRSKKMKDRIQGLRRLDQRIMEVLGWQPRED